MYDIASEQFDFYSVQIKLSYLMSSTYGTTFKKKEETLNTEYRNIKIPKPLTG